MLITIILLAFLAFSRNWVEVENDQTAYLPASCETKQALNVMSDQFTTYGTAEVMVANITYDEAEALSGRIGAVKGVQSVAFDETSGHYARTSALFTVTFDRAETDDACLTSLDAVKELLTDYDLFVSTDLGNTLAETIDSEVSVIMVYVAVIIVAVLILTSRTYGEVPALLLTFIAAMVFMQFKIDPDMGICLMKSILFALLAVFIVMPALLVLFVPLIEKTEHRSWVPKISFAGRYAWASRKVVPFVFLTVSAACFFLSGKCPYAYGYSNLTTPKLNETQIAEKLIDDTFTTPNMLAFVVPAGDYEKEAALLTELGFAARSIDRGANTVLYFKKSEAIEDFLTKIGAPCAAMDIMSAKVEKSMNNSINRKVNCDTANADKVVAAAQEQIDAIRRIERDYGLDVLPEKLQSAALLRIANPEASLADLATLSYPPVTKSCLNYRLKKLMEFHMDD